MTTSKTDKPVSNGLLVVPSSWVVYDLTDMDTTTIMQMNAVAGAQQAPSVAVMEALVMVGKVKRVASIHTFNALEDAEDENEEPDSPFAGEDE